MRAGNNLLPRKQTVYRGMTASARSGRPDPVLCRWRTRSKPPHPALHALSRSAPRAPTLCSPRHFHRHFPCLVPPTRPFRLAPPHLLPDVAFPCVLPAPLPRQTEKGNGLIGRNAVTCVPPVRSRRPILLKMEKPPRVGRAAKPHPLKEPSERYRYFTGLKP